MKNILRFGIAMICAILMYLLVEKHDPQSTEAFNQLVEEHVEQALAMTTPRIQLNEDVVGKYFFIGNDSFFYETKFNIGSTSINVSEFGGYGLTFRVKDVILVSQEDYQKNYDVVNSFELIIDNNWLPFEEFGYIRQVSRVNQINGRHVENMLIELISISDEDEPIVGLKLLFVEENPDGVFVFDNKSYTYKETLYKALRKNVTL